MQENKNCNVCSDKDETVHHIISHCNKQAQKKHKSSHDWVKKVIHFVLCKRLKSYYTDKWYKHNPKSALENVTLKILGDFEVQTERTILVRRPDLVWINYRKINCHHVYFTVPADQSVKIRKSKHLSKYLDLSKSWKSCVKWRWWW